MLRLFTGLLFGLFVIASGAALLGMALDGLPYNLMGCISSNIIFIMGCIGLFVLITTKAHITISKQFVTEKPVETNKSKRK